MITSDTMPEDLAVLLGTSYSKLNYVIYKKGVGTFYKAFEINKKNGEKRVIRSPDFILKNLQRRMKNHLELIYKPHDAATAFIQGRGIVNNAKRHVKKAAVLNLDLEGFYDSINFGRVRGLLIAKPYALNADVARIIAHICCVDKVLPQGAPTSPILSNMICRRLDKELSLLAKESGAQYSRYADDITFSFRSLENSAIYEKNGTDVILSERLISIISGNGFTVKASKTRVNYSNERQVVTGLKVNKKVNIDRRYIRTTRAMIHSLSNGIKAANDLYASKLGFGGVSLEYVVSGRINFIGMVKGKDSSVYQGLARAFNSLDISLEVPLIAVAKKSDIEERLHFYGKARRQLENCVWVVSFDGIEPLTDEEQCCQATAFMLSGGYLLTAHHAFLKAGNPSFCFVNRIQEPSKKYKADLIDFDKRSDIARLKIQGDYSVSSLLKVSPIVDFKKGYKLAAVGFPEWRLGHASVSITPCTITNQVAIAGLKHFNVDVEFKAGISGGPVVNAWMQVVGMALMGTDVADGSLKGLSTFISAEHFP